jgi:hypothetical protein
MFGWVNASVTSSMCASRLEFLLSKDLTFAVAATLVTFPAASVSAMQFTSRETPVQAWRACFM